MPGDKTGDQTNVFSAIKWVCIAVVVLALTFVAYKAYRLVAAPAEAVGNAAEGVTGAVKSGADAVKDRSSAVYNRLDIPAPNQRRLNRAAETAFAILTSLPATEAEGVKDGLIRMRHLGGHEGQVCTMAHNFGNGAIPVHIAADNDAYATSKSLGAQDDRRMRMVILTDSDDVAFKVEWDPQLSGWQMKWKATTVKKEIGNDMAAQRIMDILQAVKAACALPK